MDRALVLEKLESLARCVRRLEEKRPSDLAVLRTDVDAQDIVCVNLERAVQLSVDVALHLLADAGGPPPSTMGESFDALARAGWLSNELAVRMKKAVGFRNVAVHAYRRLDWDIVGKVLVSGTEDFKAFAAQVLRVLDKGNP